MSWFPFLLASIKRGCCCLHIVSFSAQVLTIIGNTGAIFVQQPPLFSWSLVSSGRCYSAIFHCLDTEQIRYFGILAFYRDLFGQTLFVPGQGGTTITNIKQSAEKNKSSSGQIKLCYSQLQTIQSKVQSINVYLELTFCLQST